MKTKTCLLVFLYSMLITLPLASQTTVDEPEKGEPSISEEAIHDEIRTMRDEIIKAVAAKDIDALLVHLHPDVVLTTMDDKDLTVIRKHAGVRDYLSRCLTGADAAIKSIKPQIAVDELTILHGDDTGVAFGSSDENYEMTNGQTIEANGRWSATLVKDEGAWKVANLQFSYNPFDNPVLNATAWFTYWIAGGTALVGCVLGCIVMRLLRKSTN